MLTPSATHKLSPPPQVIHTHYLLVPALGLEEILKVELLEDLMLSLCLKSAHLAVKLVWWLRGYLEDLSAISEGDLSTVIYYQEYTADDAKRSSYKVFCIELI